MSDDSKKQLLRRTMALDILLSRNAKKRAANLLAITEPQRRTRKHSKVDGQNL